MIFEFWGRYACFSRPELKVEKYSYDIPTPSALRCMISGIYWHPGIIWRIEKFHVLNPIRHEIIKRNEIGRVVPLIRNAETALSSVIVADQSVREQRSARILRDVHYAVSARFEITDKASPCDNEGKVLSIVNRRLESGQCFSQPYFGCREFAASFRKWPEGKPIEAIHESRDFGLMLYDLDYSDPADIRPMYFHAVMEDGVVDVQNAEVLR